MKVDVKQLVHSKSPALARVKPLVGYLRRVIHEREVNEYVELFSHLGAVDFIRASLDRMGITYRAVGLDRLDPAGRYIFASNHPFGGLDGVMLAERVSERFGDVKVVVNDLLMYLTPLSSLFIPINKHGRQSGDYARAYNEAFASNVPIITFPAGMCSRRRRGVVCDLEWKPSFVRQAVATRRDVVPVYFDGRLSNFFYRLSSLRTGLGIKANIEMVYLIDEMFRQSGSHFDILVGEPVSWETLAAKKSPRAAARELYEMAYNLGKQK